MTNETIHVFSVACDPTEVREVSGNAAGLLVELFEGEKLGSEGTRWEPRDGQPLRFVSNLSWDTELQAQLTKRLATGCESVVVSNFCSATPSGATDSILVEGEASFSWQASVEEEDDNYYGEDEKLSPREEVESAAWTRRTKMVTVHVDIEPEFEFAKLWVSIDIPLGSGSKIGGPTNLRRHTPVCKMR